MRLDVRTLVAASLVPLALACASDPPAADGGVADAEMADGTAAADGTSAAAIACAPDNGGITLPAGFCATVFADDLGRARHLAVRDDGAVFVMVAPGRGDSGGSGGLVALRDGDGDGVAEEREDIAVRGGTGVALDGEWVYFAPDDAVMRIRVPMGSLVPAGEPETVVSGLPGQGSHSAKSIALANGRVYVNIGAPSNACQEEQRTAGSPGQDPCPQLERRGGVWSFDASATGQTQDDGERYATGIRNLVAITAGPDGAIYGVQHGRDQLGQLWGYSDEDSAEKPAEEMFRIDRGDDFGWPYCYYDRQLMRKVLAPEYGGDGTEVGRCADAEDPIASFPAHWAPNGIVFYEGNQFPARYRGGVFIAFHGSWNRAPLPQAGYNVVFVPFSDGAPDEEWSVFAEGFPGGDVSPRGAAHRPTAVAVGADGALFVGDDAGGRIWRIVYSGE